MEPKTFYSYQEFRNFVNDGDIILIRGEKDKFKIIQRLIMWATNSHYIHVGIAFWMYVGENRTPRLMIVEAQMGNKRRILNLSYYSVNDIDVYTSPKQWREISEDALDFVGLQPYGYFDALWVGIREKFQTWFNWNLPRLNFKGETCSEFVARMVGIKTPIVSPQTLTEELLEQGCHLKCQYRVLK